MNTNTIESTKVIQRININSMWISCKFPTGEWFKYRVTRYNTILKTTFSNNDVMSAWIKKNHTTSYGNLFNKIRVLCNTCSSGKELITKMK